MYSLNPKIGNHTLIFFLHLVLRFIKSTLKVLLMYILRIVIIYSSKNYFKREQINKTEKGTVFRKDFLKGL